MQLRIIQTFVVSLIELNQANVRPVVHIVRQPGPHISVHELFWSKGSKKNVIPSLMFVHDNSYEILIHTQTQCHS